VNSPRVDVVILAWNDPELDDAIGSALASTRTEVQVIVVDNASDPPVVGPSDPRVRVLRNAENLGVARGRNQGAAAGNSPFLCVLDSDAVLAPDTLAVLVRSVADAPDRVLAVPVYDGQSPEASAGRAPTAMRKVMRLIGLTDQYEAMARPPDAAVWDVDFGIGACQLIRRDAFEEVGGYDETVFFGPEDVDLCLRLRERGYQVVQVRDATCRHEARRRFRRVLTRQGLRHAWSVAVYLVKSSGRRRRVRRENPG